MRPTPAPFFSRRKPVALRAFSGLRRIALALGWLGCAVTAGARTFAVDYSAKPAAADLLVHDLTVLDAGVQADFSAGQAAGRKYLAYLSAGEVNAHASYREQVAKLPVPVLAENAEWKTAQMDISRPEWAEFLVEKVARTAVARGFDGFFIDTVDTWEALSAQLPARRAEFREGMLRVIRRLRETFPGREIVVNRGFDLLPDLQGVVDGVLIESVFRTVDSDGTYRPTDKATQAALVSRIAALRKTGLPVYVLDYLKPGAPEVDATVARIRALDAEPFLSTRELDGTITGPVRVAPRRILVLFGSVLAESEVACDYETDTFTGERLQTPLEWMGYEVEFLNVGKISPPPVLDPQFAGVIFDTNLKLPYAGEAWYVDWILNQTRSGIKVLFCGQYPFQQDIERGRLLSGLGCWGTFKQISTPRGVDLRLMDKDIMGFETKVTAQPSEIEDTRAPKDAAVQMSVSSKDDAANPIQYDAIFTASWGGALLDPYTSFQASTEDQASPFDPFKYLHRIWPAGAFPAPDTSTRDGRRIFYSHIDGDGFHGVTTFAGNQICGELVRDHILKRYPLPVTVSLIESTMRCLEVGQDAKDQARFERIARDVLALPNVQVGSHSFSHPYVWVDDDEEYIPMYETRALVLKPEANLKGVDVEREIAGSVAYINGLCPPDKKVEIMLWSGNCRPGPEALRLCDRLGIESLNGGNTTISGRHPFVSNVAPRITQWDGELQIYASNQNEFVYTNNWKGPFFGGFRQVVETFTLTETPRRLKPVNIYYHFYSTATPGALRSLREAHDWAMTQKLHSVTAREFAELTRDSWKTRIYRDGPGRYVLVNQGKQRTFRLPAGAGVPDMEASHGVTGWVVAGDQMYVHTSGLAATTLVLASEARPGLYLESSEGEVEVRLFSRDRAVFAVKDLKPHYSIVLGGAAPQSAWRVTMGEKPIILRADARGRLGMTLSGDMPVVVEPDPAVAAN